MSSTDESSTDDSRDGEPQNQVGIAAFGVSKADDPSRYERIMKENAVADALRRASMPTEELAFATTPHCSKSVTATLCWAKADALERDSVKAFLRQHRTARCDM
jgi:hypothetical protein